MNSSGCRGLPAVLLTIQRIQDQLYLNTSTTTGPSFIDLEAISTVQIPGGTVPRGTESWRACGGLVAEMRTNPIDRPAADAAR